ncbi:MAG: M48 family metalloprotease [Myxococcaceae bacterium]|nr:M48 family metalloprotease [Myxococcaceae bacterium]
MAALAFLLECAATAAFLGTALSLLTWPLLAALRGPALRRIPALRADLAFVLGTLPAVGALAVVSAAAAPSLGAALGLWSDHCASHGHHLHLCILHSAGMRPVQASVGAFALALFLFRAGWLARRVVEMRERLAALEELGTRRPGHFPIIAVPGAPQLCHAVGHVHRRILVSESLAEALSALELSGALAHEEAHLRRRDPLAGLLLAVAGLFTAPFFARAFLSAWRTAAEEACDTDAACAVGDGSLVASALVRVATLQRQAAHTLEAAPAFGAIALEQRVRLLLEGERRVATSARALLAVGSVGAVGLLLALQHASFLHHAVETLLHQLF